MGWERCVDGVTLGSLEKILQVVLPSRSQNECRCQKQQDKQAWLVLALFLWICRALLYFVKLKVFFHQKVNDGQGFNSKKNLT